MGFCWSVAFYSLLFTGRSCQTFLTAATGNRPQTMWLRGTWRPWTEMFTLRMWGYKWRLNYGARSSIATGLLNRYFFGGCCLFIKHWQFWPLKPGSNNHTKLWISTYLMYLIIIRLTSCRCVLWKWLVALGALYFTWNTTLRGSTQSTTPTLVCEGR